MGTQPALWEMRSLPVSMRFLALMAAGSVTMIAAAVAAPPEEEPESSLETPGEHERPEWFKQSFLDIREDVAEAAAERPEDFRENITVK